MSNKKNKRFYNTKDGYKYFCKNTEYKIDFETYSKIVGMYLDLFLSAAYDSGTISILPFMGHMIGITSYQPELKKDINGETVLSTKIDWVSSHKYWKENPDAPRKAIRYTNIKTGMEIYRWNIYRRIAVPAEFYLYSLKFYDNGSRIINKKINAGIFPVKINPKNEVRYNKENS